MSEKGKKPASSAVVKSDLSLGELEFLVNREVWRYWANKVSKEEKEELEKTYGSLFDAWNKIHQRRYVELVDKYRLGSSKIMEMGGIKKVAQKLIEELGL